jgi:hypothetical protein
VEERAERKRRLAAFNEGLAEHQAQERKAKRAAHAQRQGEDEEEDSEFGSEGEAGGSEMEEGEDLEDETEEDMDTDDLEDEEYEEDGEDEDDDDEEDGGGGGESRGRAKKTARSAEQTAEEADAKWVPRAKLVAPESLEQCPMLKLITTRCQGGAIVANLREYARALGVKAPPVAFGDKGGGKRQLQGVLECVLAGAQMRFSAKTFHTALGAKRAAGTAPLRLPAVLQALRAVRRRAGRIARLQKEGGAKGGAKGKSPASSSGGGGGGGGGGKGKGKAKSMKDVGMNGARPLLRMPADAAVGAKDSPEGIAVPLRKMAKMAGGVRVMRSAHEKRSPRAASVAATASMKAGGAGAEASPRTPRNKKWARALMDLF